MINNLTQRNNHPSWLIFGDLNIIPCDSEKIGGNPIDHNLNHIINTTSIYYQLLDLGYKGHMETWCNNQQGNKFISA